MNIDITLIIPSCLAVFAFWLFRDKDYSQTDLVSFGNYLLSKERFDKVKEAREDLFEERFGQVSDADLSNWIDRNL